jgi:hypothetical protein
MVLFIGNLAPHRYRGRLRGETCTHWDRIRKLASGMRCCHRITCSIGIARPSLDQVGVEEWLRITVRGEVISTTRHMFGSLPLCDLEEVAEGV